MAGFKTHISTSTVVGIGYGIAGHFYGMPVSSCLVSAGACSIAGMLPDLDSGSGRPVREMMCFAAAIIPAFMIPRFQAMGCSPEEIAVAAGLIYVAVRFGVARIFSKYTVHRGMWHSIPATAIVGLLAFWLVSGDHIAIRLFKTGAFVLGFLVHLILDELWSIDMSGGRIRLKKSFGTALKFWNKGSLWSNVSCYAKLAALIVLVVGDPYLMNQLGLEHKPLPGTAQEWFAQAAESGNQLLEVLHDGFHDHDKPDSTSTATGEIPSTLSDVEAPGTLPAAATELSEALSPDGWQTVPASIPNPSNPLGTNSGASWQPTIQPSMQPTPIQPPPYGSQPQPYANPYQPAETATRPYFSPNVSPSYQR